LSHFTVCADVDDASEFVNC